MRNVYYDPFGMRLAGYQAGQNDEIQMQDQTRRARASDYDFNTLAPLRLQGLQREEAYGQFYDPLRRSAATRGENFAAYADPYLRRNLDYTEQQTQGGLFDAERVRRQGVAMANGNFPLIQTLDDTRYAPSTVQPAQPVSADPVFNQAWGDLQAAIQMEGLTFDHPIAQQHIADFEQMYGLRPGTLAAGPEQVQPAVMGWMNPVTGEITRYQSNPESYRQQAFQPQALQAANFGLNQDKAQTSAGYLDVQRQYASGQAGGDGAQEDFYFDGR